MPHIGLRSGTDWLLPSGCTGIFKFLLPIYICALHHTTSMGWDLWGGIFLSIHHWCISHLFPDFLCYLSSLWWVYHLYQWVIIIPSEWPLYFFEWLIFLISLNYLPYTAGILVICFSVGLIIIFIYVSFLQIWCSILGFVPLSRGWLPCYYFLFDGRTEIFLYYTCSFWTIYITTMVIPS